jgi:nucleoside-diphosphate-sugar epimerase
MTRILVTGALGHIGSALIHSLRPGDYQEVLLVDDLSTRRYCSLFHLPPEVPFKFIEDNICSGPLEDYFEGVDVVIHLAAITNAAGSFEIQDQVELVNFEGTERVARACLKSGSKLIFLSTTSVYGTQQKVIDENCSPEELNPQSPYAMSKLRSERLLQELGESDGLRYFVGRFGTIFGCSPGMRFHTAINKFCWQACTGQRLTVWRTALNQRRPYLDLQDAVRALEFVLETDRFDNQIYNIVTENATVAEIVDLLKLHIPDTEIRYIDAKIMNQLSYTVANDKFRKTGFEFRGRLEKGIAETVDLIRGVSQSRLSAAITQAAHKK